MSNIILQGMKAAILILAFGIAFFVTGIGVYFGYVRPFEEFKQYTCVVENKDWFAVDIEHVKVVYYINSEKYEKVIRSHEGKSGRTHVNFYYNVKDPTDIITGRDNIRIISLCSTGVGVPLVILGSVLLKKELKERKTEKEKFKMTLT